MTTLTLQISGAQELAQRLSRFGVSTDDFSRAFGASGQYLSRFFAGEVFASRGRVIGEPWPSLNDNYAAWKAEHWPGRPPLIRTGLMNRSFRFQAHKLAVELWNEADYFKYHQGGWGVPQRVMMAVDEQRAARVVKYVVGDVLDKMRAEGLI